MRQDAGGFGGAALVVGLVALCCGGPLLLGALLATGAGAWLLASGGPALAGGALLVGTILGALWLRRRGWRLDRAANTDCCAPAEPAQREVTR
ncbi:MAG TPA: hypothetical protein VFC31_12725 [Candidatus Limnocylindria bacterium]|nr:hypothetical protein [Candidatus Limnocylindria bacterium]